MTPAAVTSTLAPMAAPAHSRNSYAACLTSRDFVLFYIGQYVSFIGDRLAQLAFVAVLMGTIQAGQAVTGASSRVTLLMAVSLLPYLYMFPLSGWIIDRFRRRNVMIVCTVLQGVFAIAGAELIRAQGFHTVSPWVIYGTVLAIYTCSAVFNPAKYAFIPQIVEPEHLLAANALNTSTATISTLIGTFLGVMLIDALWRATGSETAGIVWSLWLDTVTFFVPGLLLALITGDLKRPPQPAPRAESPWRRAGEGVRHLLRHRVALRLLGLTGITWFIGGFFNAALNQVMIDFLGSSLRQYGMTFGTIGLGMFSGAILTGLICRRLSPRAVMGSGLLGTGVLLIATRLTLSVPGLRVASLFAIAATAGCAIVTMDTTFQRITPNRVRGRVFALNFLVATGALVTGMVAFLGAQRLGVSSWLLGAMPRLTTASSVNFQLLGLVAMAGGLLAWQGETPMRRGWRQRRMI